MSNGTTNWPVRVAHPSAPASGRVLKYIFDDGAGSTQPYYMLEDGVPRTLVGPQGIQGNAGNDGLDGADGKTILNGAADPVTEGVDGDFYINTSSDEIFGPKSGGVWGAGTSLVGPQGVQGIQGIQGPAGPMRVEALISETGTVTLPNSTVKQDIYTDPVTISGSGDCFLDISLAIRPHNASNDMEFDISFGGNILSPEYVEEHKDVSAAQSMWRSQCLDLGNLAAGTYTMILRFSKESTGGTAQLKNYTAKVVRYS